MSKGTKAHAIIVGRMGDTINVRSTQNGKKIGNFRLACVDGYGDHEQTSWFDIVVFDERKVEVLQKYTGKGSRVMAIGTLRVREWKDRDNNKRYSTECVVNFDGSIELMDSKEEAQKHGTVQDRGQFGGDQQPSQGSGGFGGFGDDDDVPF